MSESIVTKIISIVQERQNMDDARQLKPAILPMLPDSVSTRSACILSNSTMSGCLRK